MRIKDDLEQ